MMTEAKVYHRKQSDEWATPRAFLKTLESEFGAWALDAAATAENAVAPQWFTREDDALSRAVWQPTPMDRRLGPIWLNPPYSRLEAFMRRAAFQATIGSTVVCLVPARTDTSWFHDLVWNNRQHRCRPGVSLRLIRGRLTFEGAAHSAPFPSMLVIFRPAVSA